MAAGLLALEPLHRVAQAVAGGVEVGVVDLVRVAGEDDLGAFAGAADDGLDLVRREVLGLVDDHELAGDRAAADVGQRLELDADPRDQLVDALLGGRRPVGRRWCRPIR